MLLLLLILLLLLHFTWINNFFRYLPTYIILSGSHFLRICTKSKECVWECAKRKREENEIRWVVFALVWAKSTQLFCCFVDVVLLGNRKRKEREIWSSSLWSIEQLVVVISYKTIFTLLQQLTREKYFGTFYDVDIKWKVFFLFR